jgi:hypothetical protein
MNLSTTDVLKALIRTIETTGGVAKAPNGFYEPYGERDWIDLGQCYIHACEVLGRKPQITLVDENGVEIEDES